MGVRTWDNIYLVTFNQDKGRVEVDSRDLSRRRDVTVTELEGDSSLSSSNSATLAYRTTSLTATYLGRVNGGLLFQSTDGSYYLVTNRDLEVGARVRGFDSGATTPVCLLAGTQIATPDGPRAIETLQVGDLVSTPSGPQAVKFLAESSNTRQSLQALGKMPIRIAAGALGSQGPERDTFLSPSHAVALDGHLVEAGALLNGSTVTQLETFDSLLITYFNIELEAHDLIWANGLQVESYFASYRTNGFSRDSWDNYADYLELYGHSAPMAELDLPRIPFARQLPATVRLLLQRQEVPVRAALSL